MLRHPALASLTALAAMSTLALPRVAGADLVSSGPYVIPQTLPYGLPDRAPAVTTAGPMTAWVAFVRHGIGVPDAVEVQRVDRVMGPLPSSALRDSAPGLSISFGDLALTNDGAAPIVVHGERMGSTGVPFARARRFDLTTGTTTNTALPTSTSVSTVNALVSLYAVAGTPTGTGVPLSYGYALLSTMPGPQTVVNEVVVNPSVSAVVTGMLASTFPGTSASVARAGAVTGFTYRDYPTSNWRFGSSLPAGTPPGAVSIATVNPVVVPVMDGRFMAIASVPGDPMGVLRCAFRAPGGTGSTAPAPCATLPTAAEEISAAPDPFRADSAWLVASPLGGGPLVVQLVNEPTHPSVTLPLPPDLGADRCHHARIAAFDHSTALVAAECAHGTGDSTPTRIAVWIVTLVIIPPADGGVDGGAVEGGLADANAADVLNPSDGSSNRDGGDEMDARSESDGAPGPDAPISDDTTTPPGNDAGTVPLDSQPGQGPHFRGSGCACRASGAPRGARSVGWTLALGVAAFASGLRARRRRTRR